MSDHMLYMRVGFPCVSSTKTFQKKLTQTPWISLEFDDMIPMFVLGHDFSSGATLGATLKFSGSQFPGSVENRSATRRWSHR